MKQKSNRCRKKKKNLMVTREWRQRGIKWEIEIDIYTLLCESESCSVVSDSLWPHGLNIYSPWNSPGYNTGVEPFPSPGDLPNPGIESRTPTLQADSLSSEPQEKPKNTGVGSLSLLQQIFPTQESNQGLLHCR